MRPFLALVRDFRGAMMGRADKGVILTTGSFTSGARQEAARDGVPPIELVDGEKLVNMLEELELGLKPIRAYRIDQSLFDELKGLAVGSALCALSAPGGIHPSRAAVILIGQPARRERASRARICPDPLPSPSRRRAAASVIPPPTAPPRSDDDCRSRASLTVRARRCMVYLYTRRGGAVIG